MLKRTEDAVKDTIVNGGDVDTALKNLSNLDPNTVDPTDITKAINGHNQSISDLKAAVAEAKTVGLSIYNHLNTAYGPTSTSELFETDTALDSEIKIRMSSYRDHIVHKTTTDALPALTKQAVEKLKNESKIQVAGPDYNTYKTFLQQELARVASPSNGFTDEAAVDNALDAVLQASTSLSLTPQEIRHAKENPAFVGEKTAKALNLKIDFYRNRLEKDLSMKIEDKDQKFEQALEDLRGKYRDPSPQSQINTMINAMIVKNTAHLIFGHEIIPYKASTLSTKAAHSSLSSADSQQRVADHHLHVQEVHKQIFQHIELLKTHHAGDQPPLEHLKEIENLHTAVKTTLANTTHTHGDLSTHVKELETLKTKHIDPLPVGLHKDNLLAQHDHVVQALKAHVDHIVHHETAHAPKVL